MKIPLQTFAMQVPRLLHLLEVVECRSINRAASRLNISQPALSRSIRTLEQTLGVPLVDRSAKGIVPTAHGELMLMHARTIGVNLKQALTDLETLSDARRGEIALGATPAVSALVTAAIERLQVEQPELVVRAAESASTNFIAELRTGELDVFVGPAMETPESDMIEEHLFTERFSLWVRTSHPLLRARSLRLSDLADQSWVIPQRESSLRQRLDSELHKARVKLSGPITETSSLLLVKALLLSSDRIALLAPAVLSTENQAGLVRILKGRWSFPSRSYSIYVRKNRARSAPLRALIRTIKSVVR